MSTEKMSQAEWLSVLSQHFGDPDPEVKLGLEDAARLLSEGALRRSQVEDAIDGGWDPSAETITDYLYGIDEAAHPTRW
ncbi:MAG: hypothetical protein U0822_01405 [Anaerolineae bacterium]